MMRQKADWYDRPPSTIASVSEAWAASTSTAIGLPAAILAPFGILALRTPRAADKLVAALFVVAYYAFWKAYLPARFVIFVAPIVCLFAAATCQLLINSPIRILRNLGIGLAVLAILWPLSLSAIGIFQRSTDARTQAARYLAEAFPPGTTVAVASDAARYQWRHHQWGYPTIDFERYRETPFLHRPEVVIVTSFETGRMQQARNSEHLLQGYKWNPDRASDWYENIPPSPDVFRFYADLFGTTEYELIQEFSHPMRLNFWGISPDIYVYRKRFGRSADGAIRN